MNLSLEHLLSSLRGDLLWSAHVESVSGVATDSRKVKAGEVFIALPGESFDGHAFVQTALRTGAAGVVVSRRVEPPDELRRNTFAVMVDDTVRAFGRVAADHRRRSKALVVGVTGSNGKTTTRELIHHLLSADRCGTRSQKSFNNFVGVPVTLLGIEPAHEFAVVEIGTNAPDEIARLTALAKPDIAVITTVGPCHLAGLASIQGVLWEKTDIVAGLAPGGTAIVNADIPEMMELAAAKLPAGGKLIGFGRSEKADIRAAQVRTALEGSDFVVSGGLRVRLPVPGEHNVCNALAAIAVARATGMTDARIVARLAEFRLPDQRLQREEVGTVTLVNDAYNANPLSMDAALDVLRLVPQNRRRVFCAGDMLELGPDAATFHRRLGERAGAAGVGLLFAVGPNAGQTAAGAATVGLNGRSVETFADSGAAAEAIKGRVRPGDFVLVKGSRGIRMEKVADAVRACFA